MSELHQLPRQELIRLLKSTFLRWEKLRAVYNLVLFLTMWELLVDPQEQLRDPENMALCLFAAVAANLCYFLGPLAESYFHWLDWRGRWVTAAIFGAGTLLSLPLVAFVLETGAMEWHWG